MSGHEVIAELRDRTTRAVDLDKDMWAQVSSSIRTETMAEFRTHLDRLGIRPPPELMRQAAAAEASRGRRLLLRHPGVRRSHTPGRTRAFPPRWDRTMARRLSFGSASGRAVAARAGTIFGTGQADLCALFNVGIAAFDQLCDGMPESGAQLLATLTADGLARLGRGSDLAELHRLANRAPDSDVRYVLRRVAGFFETLSGCTFATPHFRRRLTELLVAAYLAEARAFAPGYASWSRAVLHQARQEAAELPFHIIAAIAVADGDRRQRHLAAESAALLGRAVALLDDACDVTDDARSASLNAILLDAVPDPAQLVAPAERLRALARADANGHVLATARRAAAALAEFIGPSPSSRETLDDADASLLTHLINWGSRQPSATPAPAYAIAPARPRADALPPQTWRKDHDRTDDTSA